MTDGGNPTIGERNPRIRELIALYRDTDPEVSQRASDELIIENGGLINYLIDKSYSSYKAKHQEDLFQAGALGMVASLRTFDPDRGTFSTHAAHYIEHELHDYVTSFVNGIKPHYSRNVKRVRRAKEALSLQGILNPTPTDLAMESGLPVTEVKRALDVIERSQLISTDSEEARDAMLSTHTQGPSEVYDEKELMETLCKCLVDLPWEEMTAICMKYRLGKWSNEEVITNADIAKSINVPTGSVKGILSSAIRKLRKNKALSTMLSDTAGKHKDKTSDVSVVPEAGALRETEYLMEDDEEVFVGDRSTAREFFKDCHRDLID